jgi:hypothetical protein
MMAVPTQAVAIRAGGENDKCVNVNKTIADRNIGMDRKNPPIATPRVTVTFCKKDVLPGVPAYKTNTYHVITFLWSYHRYNNSYTI